MRDQYHYGQKIEVKGGDYLIEFTGIIPKAQPFISNVPTDETKHNVKINGVSFNGLTTSQLNVLINAGQTHREVLEDNLEPLKTK